MRTKAPCEVCRKYAQAKGREVNCLECPYLPKVLPGNESVVQVYVATQNQVIVAGLGTIVGLRQDAVWEYMDRYEIENPLEVFEGVMKLFDTMLERDMQQQKLKSMSKGKGGAK